MTEPMRFAGSSFAQIVLVSNNTLLHLSTSERAPADNFAEQPVMPATMSLVTVIAGLAPKAALIRDAESRR